MYRRKQVITTIKPTGDVEIETKGFVGRECFAETRDLEEGLGGATRTRPTTESRKKADREVTRGR